MGDIPRLLTQSISFPWRKRRESRGEPAGAERTHEGTASGPGRLVLIGGTSLPDDLVLEMIRLAGGRNARVAIVPSASLEFARAGERYARGFKRFGVRAVDVVDIHNRDLADDEGRAGRLAKADLIFLGGGDDAVFLEILQDTAAHAALMKAFGRGAVVAGIGAGAAALGALVPVGNGRENLSLKTGLGLLPAVLLDRNLGRYGVAGGIFVAMAACEAGRRVDCLAVGIDDATALVIEKDCHGRVTGDGMVVVFNRQEEAAAGVAPFDGLCAQILPSGYGYDFALRRPLPPRGDDGSLRQAR